MKKNPKPQTNPKNLHPPTPKKSHAGPCICEQTPRLILKCKDLITRPMTVFCSVNS